ncbi:SMP-30/gluconolactonase/LRE family protein [Methylomicrobium sp. RS1]|uniref:SMP-30/gluconolactonase/LRE family protein n=1 Tax=Candidatus Methylomicrobium oryzae TaxID=2802053 RepID=UPI001921A3D6|nr:SMP-30/gluconolactonase/LRE family protein [Methylomicrobium sp. RS1]MBL1265978.1 SMP-30/gluconolactonase/LRE family protein [Methylomicrobium sp. RS1]
MLLKSISSLGLLLVAGAVQADDPVTPAIPGVAAGGVVIELIQDGFKGTEGPIAHPDGSLLFTETQANNILRIAPDDQVSVFLKNSNGSNGLAWGSEGELYAVQTVKTKVGVVYPANKKKTLAEKFEGVEFQRPNDLVRASNGAIYFTDSGTRPTKEQPNPPPSHPGVFYISPSGELKRLANDIERPNGIQLSKDEKVLYVANTLGEHILAYDIAADGSISNRRNFAKLEGWKQGEEGWSSGADGLALDDESRLYVASNAGVEVFDAAGGALGVIPIPKKPQNLAFAGKDKKILYVVGRGAAYKIPLLAQGIGSRAK